MCYCVGDYMNAYECVCVCVYVKCFIIAVYCTQGPNVALVW